MTMLVVVYSEYRNTDNANDDVGGGIMNIVILIMRMTMLSVACHEKGN